MNCDCCPCCSIRNGVCWSNGVRSSQLRWSNGVAHHHQWRDESVQWASEPNAVSVPVAKICPTSTTMSVVTKQNESILFHDPKPSAMIPTERQRLHELQKLVKQAWQDPEISAAVHKDGSSVMETLADVMDVVIEVMDEDASLGSGDEMRNSGIRTRPAIAGRNSGGP